MNNQRGFTVIELIVVLTFTIVAAIVFFNQKVATEATQRDATRKTAINAIHYDLEKVFFAKNKHYPQTLATDTLTAVHPDLLTDTNGTKLGEPASEYHYEGTNCNQSAQCKSYVLKVTLEREAEYTKTSTQ